MSENCEIHFRVVFIFIELFAIPFLIVRGIGADRGMLNHDKCKRRGNLWWQRLRSYASGVVVVLAY
jgi:hypothetical protein